MRRRPGSTSPPEPPWRWLAGLPRWGWWGAALLAAAAALLAAFARPAAQALLASPLGLFPGGRESAHYAAALRGAALGWLAALPALLLAAALLCRQWHEAVGGARPRPPAAAALVLVLAALLGAAAAVPHQPTGDEPAYLAMARSLARDGDLVLAPDDPAMHLSPAAAAPRSLHDPGLPALLAAPDAAAGDLGVRCAEVGLAILLLVAVRALLGSAVPDSQAVLMTVLLAASFPVAVYARLALPELTGAACLTLLHLRLWRQRRTGAATAAALALLPWLHVRLLLPALLYAGVGASHARPRRRAVLLSLLPLAGSLVVMVLLHLRWFGSPSPFAAWYGRSHLLTAAAVLPGSLGILLDQQYGLLVWAPFLLLLPLGAAALWREHRDETALLAAAVVLTAGPGVLHQWWAGWSPPSRFLVPAVGLLALPAALGLARALAGDYADRVAAGVLLSAQALVGAVAVLLPGKLYGTLEATPRNYFLDLVGRATGLDTTWILPSLRSSAGTGPILHAAALVAVWLLVCALWDRRLRRLQPRRAQTSQAPPSVGRA